MLGPTHFIDKGLDQAGRRGARLRHEGNIPDVEGAQRNKLIF